MYHQSTGPLLPTMNTTGAYRRARRILTHPTTRGRRLRTLRQVARVHARGALGLSTVVPLGDRSRILASPESTSSMRAVYASPPDAAEVAVWRRWLAPGDLFLDVGANVGLYSLLAAELGAQVVALEPDEAARSWLEQNVALNGYSVRVVPAAVGAEVGEVCFSVAADVYGHVVDGGVEAPESTRVPLTTVDEVLAGRYAAGVKVDVEGYERPVVEGMLSALSDARVGLLQLEWNAASQIRAGEDREPLRALLARYGYGVYEPVRGGLVPLDGVPRGANVFAARAEVAGLLR